MNDDKSGWGYEPEVGSGLFLRIENGDKLRLRIVSEPVYFLKSWNDRDPSDRWGVIVLAKIAKDGRKAHSVHAWEFGPMVKKQLAALYKNEDWGDVTSYDITVERKGSGLDSTYTVVPQPKKPLDDADEALVKAFGKTPQEIFLKPQVKSAGHDEYDPFMED